MKKLVLALLLFLYLFSFSQVKLSDLKGKYFGQKVPAGKPLLFAPEFIS